ncbi:MAG: hypothetical protein F6K18_05340 [Okeania sp. SIO2C2]|uniref:hypothetical protein n=1 Tax=Okeania sp. SIO2C2 TaxID=2607787 RepID=UPI0013BC2D76|nr:hypothetical protein [Okeania sp. SIO2C2]NEP86292.1 hypothetical protein [Okeania sp. SIO2C2]
MTNFEIESRPMVVFSTSPNFCTKFFANSWGFRANLWANLCANFWANFWANSWN